MPKLKIELMTARAVSALRVAPRSQTVSSKAMTSSRSMALAGCCHGNAAAQLMPYAINVR